MIDVKLTNAKIFCSNEEFECLGISRGKVTFLGRDRGEEAKKVYDLNGKVVIPGYIDSHTHLVNLGRSTVDVTGLSRYDTIARMIDEAKKVAKKVLVGRGWDESQWRDREYLTRQELDQIPKPSILVRRDGHMAVANTKALQILSMTERKDGILREGEMKLVRRLQHQDVEEIETDLLYAFQQCLSQGVTCVRDIVDKPTFDAHLRLQKDRRLKVKLAVYHEEFEEYMTRAKEFWGVKVFMDGSIGAKTAAVSTWAAEGNLLLSDTELERIARRFWEKGIPLAAHAIGDAAIETVIDVFSKCKDGKIINSIEHFELVKEEFLDRVKNTFLSCQPNFLQWSKRGGLYEERLGEDWLKKNNPYRLILDKNLPLAFGSDCMPIGPSYGIYHAVNSEFEKQRIKVDEAIRCYTEHSAFLCNMSDSCGIIREGVDADLAVFDERYLTDLAKIKDKKPCATLIQGKVVYGKL